MAWRALLVFLGTVAVLATAEAGRWGWQEGRTFGGPGYALASKHFVVIPEAAGEGLAEAAADLAQAMTIRYGRTVRVVRSDWRRPRYAVYLGAIPSVRTALRVPPDLETDGFAVHWRGSRVFVVGRTEAGAMNGAYGLAADEVGARWYWPGAVGFELVPPREWNGPPPRYREEDPGFLMRWLSPLRNAGEEAFGRRNRLVRNHSFNHNLFRVFDEAAFARAPEAFSLVMGARREPRGSGKFDPQPDFTSAAAVDVAAEAVLRHFEEEPDSTSFSLSINDNVLFDESDATREAVAPLRFFRDRPVYTDLVFGFMNRVAERVFDEAGMWTTPEGEPRFITSLAYYWTEAAPTIQLHPRVMPVLTSDRAQWHDPAYREEDRRLIATWSGSGADRLGTWDYYFGSPYPYPRQLNRWIGESLPYLHDHGVRVFFSQLPSAWGLDGCKAWVAARLLWDPGADWQVLVEEYYTHFFGDAAEPMRRFYEMAETRRNNHAGPANWIKFYKDEAGIELFPPAFCAELRMEIERARAAVAGDARRLRRVEIVSEAFSLTEAYAAFHFVRRGLSRAVLDLAEEAAVDAVPRLDAALVRFVGARRGYNRLARELIESPYHSRLSAVLDLGQSDPVPLALAARARAFLAKGDAGMPPLPGAVARIRKYAALAALAGQWSGNAASLKPLLQNSVLRWGPMPPEPASFLGPPLPDLPEWYFGFRPAPRFAVEPLTEAPTGARRGVRISGADAVSFYAAPPVHPARDYLLGLRCAWRVSPDNRSLLQAEWYDEDGAELGSELLFAFPTGEEGMRFLEFPLHSPEDAAWLRLKFFLSRQYPGDHLSVEEVDLREAPAHP